MIQTVVLVVSFVAFAVLINAFAIYCLTEKEIWATVSIVSGIVLVNMMIIDLAMSITEKALGG